MQTRLDAEREATLQASFGTPLKAWQDVVYIYFSSTICVAGLSHLFPFKICTLHDHTAAF